MKKKIGIFYFSGTGNTRAIAKLFQKYFVKKDCDCELFEIDQLTKEGIEKPDYQCYDLIGIGSPIYGSNAVQCVEQFAERLSQTNRNQKAFVFTTGADYISINHGASYKSRDLLSHKGYTIVMDKVYPMGSNWCVKYDDEMTWQLYLANERKINIDVERILRNESTVDKKRWFPALCAFLGKSEHFGARIMSKGFAVNSSCTNCGKCIRDCPTKNITEENDNIQFGNACILCMRCIYNCPVDAIYLKCYKFMAVKDGYQFEKLLSNDKLQGNYLNDKTKGYYKHFYEYVKDSFF